MLSLYSLLLLLLAQDKQDRTPILQDPIENWKAQIFSRDVRGDLVLAAELQGRRMIPVDLVRKILDVEDIRAVYYTEPGDKAQKSMRFDIKADGARVDDSQKLILLRGHILVEGEDGSRLETSELELHLDQRKFRTAQEIRLKSSTLTFTGRGLEADDALRQVTIVENGHVSGRLADPRAGAVEAAKKPYLDFLSPGPMTVRETERGVRFLIQGTGGTKIHIVEAANDVQVRCDAAAILVRKVEKEAEAEYVSLTGFPVVTMGGNRIRARSGTIDRVNGRTEFQGGVEAVLSSNANQPPVHVRAGRLVQYGEWVDGTMQPRAVDASGDVEVAGFAGVRASCGVFTYDVREQKGVLVGHPRISVVRGDSRIASDEAHIDDRNGTTRFVGAVDAFVQPAPDRKPVHLVSQELVQQSRIEGTMWHPEWIEARGDVDLEVPPEEGRDAVRARCESFWFDIPRERGVLRGGPWVRITSGATLVLAARALFPDRESIVLQGPKRVRIVQENGDTATVSSRGDMSIIAADRRIKMVDRCEVFTKDSRVTADRVDVRLAADGKSVESTRASGRVEVERPLEGARLFGDQLTVKNGMAELRGWPHVTLARPSMAAVMPVVRFDPRTGRAEGGRTRFRFKEDSTP